MRHIKGILVLALTMVIPLAIGGQANAASEPTVQELHVTAKVAHHRDIVIDAAGNILEITSNTPQDVRPDVYLGIATPRNKKPLTDKLYKQYRQLVPEGTANYGVLYQRGIPVSLLRRDASQPWLGYGRTQS